MGAVLQTELAAVTIEPLNGPDKGRALEVRSERITLGRSESADVVVQSEGVSRMHAVIEKNDGAWFIQDNNSKNGVLVNGKNVRESWLTDGDVIQIGSSVFRWRDPEGPPAVDAPASSEFAMDGGIAGADAFSAIPMPDAPAYDATPKKKPNRRLLIYGVLGLVVAMIYLSQNAKPKTDDSGSLDAMLAQRDELRTKLDALDGGTQSVERANLRASLTKEIEKVERTMSVKQREFDSGKMPEAVLEEKLRKSSVVAIEDPVYKAAEAEMARLDWSNTALREAEQYFRRGQREYLQGSLQRAIDSFRTALALSSGHKLAEHYLRRAIYDAETDAKKQMELGLRYFETLQYQRAMYHFNEVQALMAHRPKEKIVSESERYNTLCKRALQAAELFP